MKIDEAKEAVKAILPAKRFKHTLGVVETAEKLAGRYGADVGQAKLAAMLHDIAKYFSKEDLQALIERRKDIPKDVLDYHLSLWHAPAGAAYVQEHYNIQDQAVLDAITYHTTGRKDMTKLEKIVFLADYIEPGRDFPGVDEVRAIAEQSLDEAVIKSLQNTIILLVQKRQQVYPLTLNAYNDLIKKVRS